MLADRPDGRRLTADEQRQLDDLERRLLYGASAPPRPVPQDRHGRARRSAVTTIRQPIALVGAVLLVGLLALATIVGGLGGLAATAAALLATSLVCQVSRLGRVRPGQWRLQR